MDKKKRNLAGKRRRKAKKTLPYMSAKKFRLKEARKTMVTSDPLPPTVPSLDVCNKAKQDALDEKINLHNYPGSVLGSLDEIARQHNYIRSFRTCPFEIVYFTDEQIKHFREALQLKEVEVSFDASGSFVTRAPIYEKNRSDPIFLYVLVVRIEGKIYPVLQVLSSVHHTHAIARWLKLHKKVTGVRPSVIVEDGSSALLCGTSLAYNGRTYRSFLTVCFRILKGEPIPLPPCLLKRDRAHMINNVVNWKGYDTWNKKVKDFYPRCTPE